MPDLTDLARRAVACPGWRWVAGMVGLDGYRLGDEDVAPMAEAGGRSHADVYRPLPDLSDPATLGCLLHLVREAWGGYPVNVVFEMNGRLAVVIGTIQHFERWFEGASAGEALVAALEAAPRRTP